MNGTGAGLNRQHGQHAHVGQFGAHRQSVSRPHKGADRRVRRASRDGDLGCALRDRRRHRSVRAGRLRGRGHLSPHATATESDYALAAAAGARPFFGQAGFTLIAVATMVSTSSAINATLYGAAKFTYLMGLAGFLIIFAAVSLATAGASGARATRYVSLFNQRREQPDPYAILRSSSPFGGHIMIVRMCNERQLADDERHAYRRIFCPPGLQGQRRA